MGNLPLLFTLSFILLVSTLPSTVSAITTSIQATSTVGKDQVPCTMCAGCENPCQPLPSPPPPVIEYPPPPLPAVVECPPPPKPTCGACETLPPPKPPCKDGTCLPSLTPPLPWMPPGPPQSQYPPEQPYFPPGPPRPPYPYPPGFYYPPGTPFPPDYDHKNDGGKFMPALRFCNPTSYFLYFTLQSLTSVALLFLPYYLLVHVGALFR